MTQQSTVTVYIYQVFKAPILKVWLPQLSLSSCSFLQFLKITEQTQGHCWAIDIGSGTCLKVRSTWIIYKCHAFNTSLNWGLHVNLMVKKRKKKCFLLNSLLKLDMYMKPGTIENYQTLVYRINVHMCNALQWFKVKGCNLKSRNYNVESFIQINDIIYDTWTLYISVI